MSGISSQARGIKHKNWKLGSVLCFAEAVSQVRKSDGWGHWKFSFFQLFLPKKLSPWKLVTARLWSGQGQFKFLCMIPSISTITFFFKGPHLSPSLPPLSICLCRDIMSIYKEPPPGMFVVPDPQDMTKVKWQVPWPKAFTPSPHLHLSLKVSRNQVKSRWDLIDLAICTYVSVDPITNLMQFIQLILV